MYICKAIASFKSYIIVHLRLSLWYISFKTRKNRHLYELLLSTSTQYLHSQLIGFNVENYSLDSVSLLYNKKE